MKLSIITINFNNREGLRKTIKSVVEQTWRKFEYIVIDGNSTDGSVDILEDNSDDISYWVSEPDKGIYHAMNKGIDASHGDYLLFLNSGDYFYDNTVIQDIVNFNSCEDIIIGKLLFLNNNEFSNVIAPITMLRFYGGSIPHPATFIRRDLFKNNRFDENYKVVSDWKFFIQVLIIEECSYRIIDRCISCFESGGISAENHALIEKEKQEVLTDLLPYGVRLDYLHFLKGSNYTETEYDKFYVQLRKYKYAKIVYFFSVLFVRFISLFKKSALFVNDFPLKLSN